MDHPGAEDLADVAMGDEPAAAAASHVQACGECDAVVGEYRRVLTLLAGADEPTTRLDEPPAGLWAQIAETIATGEASATNEAGTTNEAKADRLPEPIELHGGGSLQEMRQRPAREGSRRGSGLTRRWLAAAAVAGLGIGLVGGYALWANGDAQGGGTAIATAELETLDSLSQRGNATVTRAEQSVDLEVTTEQFDPEGGYLEVWLINRDLTRMISVGVLPREQRQASFPISDDLIAQGYTIVDISREDFDDNPLHSGDSIVRGELQT